MPRRYLTNEYLRAEAERRGVCPECFGWGFPIMAMNGREVYNASKPCPRGCSASKLPKNPNN